MDQLDAMGVFVAIMEAGSLSEASRKLSLPLATISRKLAELEAHLKTRLITRSTRKLALTEAGESYLDACREIIKLVQEADSVAAGAYSEIKGRLVITAPIVFGRLYITPLVSQFLKKNPSVNVELVLGDQNIDLIGEHVDLALRIGRLPDSGLVAKRVGEIHCVVCASPAYLEECGVPQAPAELEQHRCITFSGLARSFGWNWDTEQGQARSTQSVAVQSSLSVNTAEAAIDAAILGLGITRVLSYQVADALREKKLVRVLAEYEPPPLPVNIVHPGQGRLPMKSRAFIDYAVPELRGRLAGHLAT